MIPIQFESSKTESSNSRMVVDRVKKENFQIL